MFDLKQCGPDQNISLSMGNSSLCHLRRCATIYVIAYRVVFKALDQFSKIRLSY